MVRQKTFSFPVHISQYNSERSQTKGVVRAKKAIRGRLRLISGLLFCITHPKS